MFIDLTDADIQPLKINEEAPEIILSEQMRGSLEKILNEEDSYAKVNPATSVVKPDSNSVFFSNQWYYLAVLCKQYALALYPYCVFFDNNIRNNQSLVKELAAGQFDSEQFSVLFESEDDKLRMKKFIQGDTEFRPGKALINIREGNRTTIRSCKDIFGSCVLKKISVPDASSGYLGNVIYYLAKHKEVFDKLETEIDSIIGTGTSGDNRAYDVLRHKLFGIHIKNDNDALSEERAHICIGWSELGNLMTVNSRSELEDLYKSIFPDVKPKALGQNVGQIWRFIHEAQIDDCVIFADGDLCHIGRITSDYYYDNSDHDGQDADYVNAHDVVWLKKNIRRADLSEALHRSLMTAMSFWTMNDYRSAIADLLSGNYVRDEMFSDLYSEDIPEGYWPSLEEYNPGISEETWVDMLVHNREDYPSTLKMLKAMLDLGGEATCSKLSDVLNESTAACISRGNTLGRRVKAELGLPPCLDGNQERYFPVPFVGRYVSEDGRKRYAWRLRPELARALKVIYEDEYEESVVAEAKAVRFITGYKSDYSSNRIVFGAPGTGKSFTVNEEAKKLIGADNETDYERVTFHPDYSYANFVGTYKPVPSKDADGNETITYEYVPGPFMRVYVNALKNGRTDDIRPFLLIIEEINRANVAAVFGDIFQLLDRNYDYISEYPIQASEDIKNYLAKELGGDPENYSKIRIPDNMFIWATMNSADQGVFPMDTAFKRRWDFTYLGIDESDADIRDKYVTVGSKEQQRIEWNSLRKSINDFLASEKINEDKQLGPYFISRSIVVPADGGSEIDSKKFCDVFKNKVLMYLFDDAAKQKRGKLFEGSARGQSRYSQICEAFDEQGIGIFNMSIQTGVKVQDLTHNEHELDENGIAKTAE